MSQVLQRIYASAPVNDTPIHTLELKAGSLWELRICDGFDNVMAGIEGGEVVLFEASGMGISLPARGVKGRQDLQFQIDNVTGKAVSLVEQANNAGIKIDVIYRVYTTSDLTAPSEPAIEMKAVDVQATGLSLNVVASFNDLVNKAWPKKRYTPSIAPGLKYFS
ncbi:DUF1833 family protein [Pseudoalteromonas prydzensis]|uniref:DUF1833 family protein n=1 Tax=Pseudoalteromonas prydzensis TaxID=182141 RepID=UPI0007E51B47|nr:DUF1833 family protein [Pseudoalteromonas prydzensis]MBE0379170.1 hypothetical protein [Pseudoalteromonas prydzensis ACAM 620]